MRINLQGINTQEKLDQFTTNLRMGVISYYEILGIPKTANIKTIHEAYHTLSLQIHPDKNPLDPLANARTTILNEAKEVLSNFDKRKEYDTLLIAQYKQQTPASPTPTRSESRTSMPSTPSTTAAKTSPNPASARATPNRSFARQKNSSIHTPHKPKKPIVYSQNDFLFLSYSELSQLQKNVDNIKIQLSMNDTSSFLVNGADYETYVKEILDDWQEAYQKLREPKGALACMSIFQGAHFLENPLKYAMKNYRTLGCPEKINPQDLNELQRLWILLKYAEAHPTERTAYALRESIRKGKAFFDEYSSPFRSQSK